MGGDMVEQIDRAKAKLAIKRIGGKTPKEAAHLIRGINDRFVSDLVNMIRKTPDEQLPAVFNGLVREHPGWAPLRDWVLAEDQRSWLAQLAAELRQPSTLQKGRGA
jgi:hypothetical protein